MWRITGDFWDRWEDLYSMFEPCRAWAPFSGNGHWPDADMLPLGRIALRSCEHGCGDRWTRFTRAEQGTMMSLWSIVGSPLMLGSFLPDLDDWTLGLLTNRDVLEMHRSACNPRQVSRSGDCVIWAADGPRRLFVHGPLQSRGSPKLPLLSPSKSRSATVTCKTCGQGRSLGRPNAFVRSRWMPMAHGSFGPANECDDRADADLHWPASR